MLTLPLHPQVTDEQQDAVVAVVRKLAIEHSRAAVAV
jgi:dTDP-4-amino-4,6-dideoxygalactose transaminase